MSYILDALRKADAERDRGNVPGIHAQPTFGGTVPPAAAGAPARPWVWLGSGALAVLVVGGVVGYLASSRREAPTPVQAQAAAPAPVSVAPAVVSPTPPPPSALAAATARSRIVDVPPVVRKPRPATPSSAPAEPKLAATEKIYALAELPDDVRRQLPNLVVGGSMYSSKPADRLLILNGQVAHEGDKVGNDLVLQQIRLKGALLNFRGYRYTISY